jgi:flagellar motor switch protein FliM
MNEHTQPLSNGDFSTLCVEEEIIEKAKTNYGRLPILEELFRQFQTSLGLTLSDYTSIKTEVALKSFEYVCFKEALDEFANPSLFGVVATKPWDGTVVVVAEAALVFPLIQIMLGGKPSANSMKARQFTRLEKRITAKFYDVVMRDLAVKLSEVAPFDLQMDAIEEDPEELDFVAEDEACAKIVMEVSLGAQSGLITFVIPYVAIEAVKDVFAQPFRGGQIGGKNTWREAISNSLQSTDVSLTAILKSMTVPLHEILAWKPDLVLDIGVDSEQDVLVTCNDKQMFNADMGCRKNGFVALKISKTLVNMES